MATIRPVASAVGLAMAKGLTQAKLGVTAPGMPPP